jgi:tryptophan halogenase
MTKQINKIVVVGGGSAGWMTASTLIKQFPNKDISVIESPNYPTVGVGESTVGGIGNWLNLINLDSHDFMKDTDASYKLSIRFTNFYRKDSGSFHYPFGIPDTQGNFDGKNDWYLKKEFYPDTPVSDYAECMYPNMSLVTKNKVTFGNKLPGFIFERDSAYHFDATKFGQYLKNKICLPNGVKLIPHDVSFVSTNDDGVESLLLTNGDSITADLFIDCTGWKSMLLAGALKEQFNSYSDLLPNNSAWATRVPYTDKEKQLECYTDCTAIENGWVWNIPLWSRIGTGYVYSDKYVSNETALEEFKAHLQSKGHSLEGLEFKNLKMRVGIHDRVWVKNVAAIGLSAGFIEPLESNGLFTVHEFLIKLCRTLNRNGYVSQVDKDNYNIACITQFKMFADFVAMHYAYSHRDDTPYWRDVGNRSFMSETSSTNLGEKSPFYTSWYERFNAHSYTNDYAGQHCILTGLHAFPQDHSQIIAYNFPRNTDLKKAFDPIINNLNYKKQKWDKLVENEPSLYEYLKNTVYKND